MTKIPGPIDFLYPPPSPGKLEKGAVLISEPMLWDNYFARSVVLITEHGEEGSVGIVLNNFATRHTEAAVEKAAGIHALIGIGGPVEPQMLCFLHTVGTLIPSAVHITGDIYSGGDFNAVKQLLEQGVIDYSELRFFIGYSGWSVGQLEEEIESRSWAVGNLPGETLFAPDKNLWTTAVKALGPAYRAWLHTPANPLFN